MSFLDGLFGSTQTPTAPSYQPFIDAYNNLANYSQTQGQNALNWAQGQVANNSQLAGQVANGAVDMGNSLYGAARTGLGQASDLVSGGIQQLKDAYAKYTDPNQKAAYMGAAGATAAQGDEAARQASLSDLESYGLNPGDVRFGGLDQGARLQDAATRVGAENTAGAQADQQALNITGAELGQGNTSNTNATSQATAGGGLNTAALTGQLANTSSGYTGLGTGLTWTTPQATALGGETGATNTQFQNQNTADQTANAASSGIGSLLGIGASALGKGGALASGGALSGIGSSLAAFLADGGMVPAGGGVLPTGALPTSAQPIGPGGNSPVAAGGPGTPTMVPPPQLPPNVNPATVQAGQNSGNFTGTGNSFAGDMTYFGPGGEVPLSASPSRGAVTDDVAASGPSGAIRLNGGEFVLPKDVVSWEGEKSLQGLIQKARQGMQGAQARPRMAVPVGAPPQPPQQGAVPV